MTEPMTNKGFTLIEAVITMVLMVIVAYIVGAALSSGSKTFIMTDQRKEALDHGRTTIERMTREMRGLHTLVGATNATSVLLCFNAVGGTNISFRYSSPNVYRGEGNSPCPTPGTENILSNKISTMGFSYYNGTVVDPSPPANTKVIKIDLTALEATESVPLRSEVRLRNK